MRQQIDFPICHPKNFQGNRLAQYALSEHCERHIERTPAGPLHALP